MQIEVLKHFTFIVFWGFFCSSVHDCLKLLCSTYHILTEEFFHGFYDCLNNMVSSSIILVVYVLHGDLHDSIVCILLICSRI